MTATSFDNAPSVEMQGLSLPGLPQFSFTAAPGEFALLLTATEEVSAMIARHLLGLERPREGRVLVFGQNTKTVSPKELVQLRQRIGLLQGLGGLVSNLKAWENLTLPLYYHRSLGHKEIEGIALPLLERVGYTGRYMELPGHLTLFQKKQIGLARALVLDPDLVIYESPEQGLNQQEKDLFYRLIREFHQERAGRISLILSCQPDSVATFPEARAAAIKGLKA